MAGTSTYSTVAGVIFVGSKTRASSSSRRSGTFAMPTCPSVDPSRVWVATPVRIVNSDVLPTWGRPMMAVFMGLQRNFYAAEDVLQDLFGLFGPAIGRT